jgi:hypothetical protein
MKSRIEGDWIPIGNYEKLIKRIKWSERLNLILFLSVLLISFGSFITIGAHTYHYEVRLEQTVNTFKDDILAITGDQNIAIRNLNNIVSDRNWINFQRVTLEQLKDFSDLRYEDPDMIIPVDGKTQEGVGGK